MSPTHQEVRQYLLEELEKDLVGPDSPDEELKESPTSYYLTGILYPANTEIDPEEDRDSAEASDDEDEIDTGTLMATASNPSAIGLTFTVPVDSSIKIYISAAIYIPKEQESGYKLWQRKKLEIEPITLMIDRSRTEDMVINSGLRLHIRLRQRETRCVVTLSLVNTHTAPKMEGVAKYCYFQPEIRVASEISEEPIFLPRVEENLNYSDPDRALNDLLYRHVPEFATGHGCAVRWDVIEGQNATEITTSIIPGYETLQFSPEPEESFQAQEMLFLADTDQQDLIGSLKVLTTRYRQWIDALDTGTIPENLLEMADQNISDCKEIADRIDQGIELLDNDPKVRQAFQLANKAMLTQRARVTWLRHTEENRTSEPIEDNSHRWRPFQLAFFLLGLPSIADPDDPYHSMVDLLWFPTGGGKTEAYLGLTAFTIFLRRLRNEGKSTGAGVTVLMRYTLRLLTIQQFQRAATLIMACERIRKNEPENLGEDNISLGLWVGGAATPNTLRKAQEGIDDLLKGERVFEGNPYQIHSCPWCDNPLTPRDYHISSVMTIRCPNEECDFVELPLYIVDEDVYRRRPSLLIGTVDKFARLPWLSEASSLFGGIDNENLPPELIIQDELHLISGPLGTLVGLYETAIDYLCQKSGISPKIIASTATIRRAADQSKGIFNRGFSQFPPPGLDARDNFFSRQVAPEVRPGRIYAGVHAPGKSMKTALLRIYAILMQKIHEHTAEPELRDPYWTLVGYFNSIRELGGAVRLVEDDVRDRINLLSRRSRQRERYIRFYRELNSRVGSDEIPRILDEMFKNMEDDNALDAVLATNMISVGVDVDRLGLMVVTGQPKMTSEYIQATSRVGRQFPGLIITLYNWTRPRDRSHYERFTSYHSSLYSQVEPTSVTPFSSRARDRGLHGVFITMVRHLIETLNPEDAAFDFDSDHPLIQEIIARIVDRVRDVDPEEAEETKLELEAICKRWQILTGGDSLTYRQNTRYPDRPHLMISAELARDSDALVFPTLNSLRDVEGESGIDIQRVR